MFVAVITVCVCVFRLLLFSCSSRPCICSGCSACCVAVVSVLVCVFWFLMHICLHRGFRVVVRVCGGGLSLAPVLLSVVVSSHVVVLVFVLSHVGCCGS